MDDIKCTVCLNQFHERDFVPKVLDCSHTFCEGCIQKLLNTSQRCPVCGNKMNQREYPRNLSTLKFVDSFNKMKITTSSVGAVKCAGEIEEVKLLLEDKREKLNGEIEELKREIEKRYKELQPLQEGLAELALLEGKKMKDMDVGEAMEVILELKMKSLCIPQEGLLTLETFKGRASYLCEIARRARKGRKVFCVEEVKETTRYGSLIDAEGCLLCHSLAPAEEEGLEQGATLVRFQELAPPRAAGKETFLVLRSGDADGAQMIRLTIRLEQCPWTRQFAHLSTGEEGPSYKGARVRDTRLHDYDGGWGHSPWGSGLLSVEKYMEGGIEGIGMIEGRYGGGVWRDCKQGEVIIKGDDDGGFEMCQVKRSIKHDSVFGVVTSPSLPVLESFLDGGPARVSDSGIRVPI